ncbi:MAG: hypothetical protein OEY09_06690 [Gammaproteobacteria bacterium]|nr:hypothetical protein [Gammaproteobacteria bacterium]
MKTQDHRQKISPSTMIGRALADEDFSIGYAVAIALKTTVLKCFSLLTNQLDNLL